MLNKPSNPYNKLNEFVVKEKEQGLKLLVIFKTIKLQIIKELTEQHSEEDVEKSMENINLKSIDLAKQIFLKCGDSPSEVETQQTIK